MGWPRSELFLAVFFACLAGCTTPTDNPNAARGGGGSAGPGGAGASAAAAGSGGSTAGTGGAAGAGGPQDGGGGGATGGAGGATGGAGGGTGGAGGATGGAGGATGGAGGATGGAGGGGADAAAGSGALGPGAHKVVVLQEVDPPTTGSDPSRQAIVEILDSMKASHGVVVAVLDTPSPATALMDAALVILGPNASTFGASRPDPGLRTLAVPMIVSKDGSTSELGLGTPLASAATYNTITLINPDHPLAAGLAAGTVTVLTTSVGQRIITFSGLGPDAIKIATGPPGATSSYSLFGYEKGADMGNGLRAPARRVGFFWHRPSAPTADGTKLFKAAVDWALRSP